MYPFPNRLSVNLHITPFKMQIKCPVDTGIKMMYTCKQSNYSIIDLNIIHVYVVLTMKIVAMILSHKIILTLSLVDSFFHYAAILISIKMQ